VQEDAEKMDRFPKPEDDTYRKYLIALAKEAQAYELASEANDRELGKRPDISKEDAEAEFNRAQQFMDEARKLYRDIVESNPKEKYFREGDARTEEALAIYSKIARFQDEYRKSLAAAPAAQPGAGGAPLPAATAKAAVAVIASPLDQVLNFCRQGVDVASIGEYIQSKEFLDDARATNYKFNFATDTLSLKEACKDGAPTLQRQIRARLNPAAAPAKPATAPASAKKP
jgi:hypothetical protein